MAFFLEGEGGCGRSCNVGAAAFKGGSSFGMMRCIGITVKKLQFWSQISMSQKLKLRFLGAL